MHTYLINLAYILGVKDFSKLEPLAPSHQPPGPWRSWIYELPQVTDFPASGCLALVASQQPHTPELTVWGASATTSPEAGKIISGWIIHQWDDRAAWGECRCPQWGWISPASLLSLMYLSSPWEPSVLASREPWLPHGCLLPPPSCSSLLLSVGEVSFNSLV